MRLDSHHQHGSSESSSLGREQHLEGTQPTTTESNNAHHRHHSTTSNSDNSMTHEPANDHHHPSNQHINATGSSQYMGTNSSDTSTRNLYKNDQSSHDLDQQSHHQPNNSRNQNAQIANENFTDDEEEEGYEHLDTNNAKSSSPFNSASPLILSGSATMTTPYNYSAASGANELLNRYCLEQTIRHLHGFQDVRNLSATVGTSSANSSLPTNLPS